MDSQSDCSVLETGADLDALRLSLVVEFPSTGADILHSTRAIQQIGVGSRFCVSLAWIVSFHFTFAFEDYIGVGSLFHFSLAWINNFLDLL